MSVGGLEAETLARLLDGLDVLVCGLDADGRILHHNRCCEEVTGLGREALQGRSWLELFARTERFESVLALWGQATAGAAPAPFEALCRNDRRIQWQFSHWPIDPNERIGVCALGVDVTNQRSELAHAREAERNVAVAQLGAGLAHEIRNPLNSAKLQLDLADRQIAASRLGRATESVQRAAHEIMRADAMLTDFLVFARPPKVALAPVDLRQVARDAAERAKVPTWGGVRADVEPGPALVIEADEELISVAIEQLVRNAIDAAASHEKRGRVDLRVRLVGNTARVDVEDDGPGLPSPDAPVFDAFFTTKPESTGLGLAIVRRVAFDHGGYVTHARHADRTIFSLHLPVVFGAPVTNEVS
jgi:PAS domain S-box-containing protein